MKALILVDPTFISLAWQQEVFESDLAAEHRRLLATAREELLAQARTRSNHSYSARNHVICSSLWRVASKMKAVTPTPISLAATMTAAAANQRCVARQ